MPVSQLLKSWIWRAASGAVLTGLVAPAVLAQQVLEGLPPPPTLPPADQYSAPAAPTAPVIVPQIQPRPQPAARPQPGVRPQPSVAPRPRTGPQSRPQAQTQKFVVVYGDSPLLLTQVQQVVPGAALYEYRGQRLIQAGQFANRSDARRQIVLLRSRGIQATLLEATPDQWVAAGPGSSARTPAPASGSGERSFAEMPSANQPFPVETAAAESRSSQEWESRAYFIVVPGDREELPAISNHIIRLGQGFAIASRIEARDDSRGSHLRIGPFANRDAAERWNRYFQDFGIDARVYFRR